MWRTELQSEDIFLRLERFGSSLPPCFLQSHGCPLNPWGLYQGSLAHLSCVLISGTSKFLQCWIQGPCRPPKCTTGMPWGGGLIPDAPTHTALKQKLVIVDYQSTASHWLVLLRPWNLVPKMGSCDYSLTGHLLNTYHVPDTGLVWERE